MNIGILDPGRVHFVSVFVSAPRALLLKKVDFKFTNVDLEGGLRASSEREHYILNALRYSRLPDKSLSDINSFTVVARRKYSPTGKRSFFPQAPLKITIDCCVVSFSIAGSLKSIKGSLHQKVYAEVDETLRIRAYFLLDYTWRIAGVARGRAAPSSG